MGKNSFEIQIRKRRLISISKDFLLKNEVRRAYYHTWEERIRREDGKTRVPTERKISQSKGESQKQTQPMYGIDAEIWRTLATFVGGDCSHLCTNLASLR